MRGPVRRKAWLAQYKHVRRARYVHRLRKPRKKTAPEILSKRRVAYNKLWRARNLERSRAYHRAYYAAHSEELMAYTVDWTRRNRDKQRASKARRRTAQNGADGAMTAAELASLIVLQGGLCFYCETEIVGRYSVDHFIPLSRGGSNWISNIRLACRSCNSRKHDKMPWEFMPLRFTEESASEQQTNSNGGHSESTG